MPALTVLEGSVPHDVDGIYIRNTEQPTFSPLGNYHPFDGDGMVHGVYFRDGKAGYRNRWIQTDALTDEQRTGKSISPGVMGPFDYSVSPFGIKDTSNTDLLYYRDQLISLW